MTDTPKNKFDKKCPVCDKWINSKGYENHVRAHGAATTKAAATTLALDAEAIVREEARAMLQTPEGKEIMREEARRILEGMMNKGGSKEATPAA